MVFFDWNKDDTIDAQDMFLEYNIFKACTEDDDFEGYDEFLDDTDEE